MENRFGFGCCGGERAPFLRAKEEAPHKEYYIFR
jgi:hypothetical protein